MYLMDFPGIENEPTFPQAEFEMMATQMSLNVLLKKIDVKLSSQITYCKNDYLY